MILNGGMPVMLSITQVHSYPLIVMVYFNLRLAVQNCHSLSQVTIGNAVVMLVLAKTYVIILHDRHYFPAFDLKPGLW